MNHKPMHRRAFLAGSASIASSVAFASPRVRVGLAADEAAEGYRNLVLIQLTGGNDGLSTVIPFADDGYHRDRPNTGHSRERVRKIDDYRALHENLASFEKLYQDGKLAIVEGVGYPDPVRSHFQSYEIWHAAHRSGRVLKEGWIGRLCGVAWPQVNNPELVVHVGSGAPFSIHSETQPPVSIASPTSYQWFGGGVKAETWRSAGVALEPREEASDASGEMDRKAPHTGRRAVLGRLRRLLDVADDSSDRVRRAALSYQAKATYPRDTFSANLRDIAGLIHGGLGTRVFSCELIGFDTHANQKDRHDELMATLDAALGAFMDDLSQSSFGRDTVVVVYSEFGRRVAENESKGHDHGQAAPMFVMGESVNGGLYGKHPSLEALDQGDLAYTTDFRRTFATVIEDWFGVDSKTVLLEGFDTLPLIAT